MNFRIFTHQATVQNSSMAVSVCFMEYEALQPLRLRYASTVIASYAFAMARRFSSAAAPACIKSAT